MYPGVVAVTFGVVFVVVFANSLVSDQHDHDHILCRKCGAELTENTYDNFVNISSPQSESTHQLPVLGHSHLLVQSLRNPADVAFDLVSVKRSGCSGLGEWYSEHSWFPEYLWRVCVCPRCLTHLGCFRLTGGGVVASAVVLAMAGDGEDMVVPDTEFLAELEEEFQQRYSQDDTQFMQHHAKTRPKPPVLPAERQDRNRQRGGYRGGNRGGQGYRNNWDNNRDNKRNFDHHSRREYHGGEKREYGGGERREYGGGERRGGGGGGFKRDYCGGERRDDMGGERREYGGGGERREFEGGARKEFRGGERREFGGRKRRDNSAGERREYGDL